MRDGDAELAPEGRYLRDQVGVRLVAQQHAQTEEMPRGDEAQAINL